MAQMLVFIDSNQEHVGQGLEGPYAVPPLQVICKEAHPVALFLELQLAPAQAHPPIRQELGLLAVTQFIHNHEVTDSMDNLMPPGANVFISSILWQSMFHEQQCAL